MSDNSLVTKILDWIIDVGVNGLGFLPSAKEVAEHYRRTCSTEEEAVDSVIKWKTAYAAGTGFVTGLGGITALPVAIPASLAASYALGANTSATIAILRGYDLNSESSSYNDFFDIGW